MEQFDALLSKVIDSTLGERCQSFGYSYSEISNQREQSLKLAWRICRVQMRLFKYFLLWCACSSVEVHALKKLLTWWRPTVIFSISAQTDAMFSMTTCLSSEDGEQRKSMGYINIYLQHEFFPFPYFCAKGTEGCYGVDVDELINFPYHRFCCAVCPSAFVWKK